MALFIFNRRAANLGYLPHAHRGYEWSLCDFRSYWNNFLLFTGRYDSFGCLLFTVSVVAAVTMLSFEPTPPQKPSYSKLYQHLYQNFYYWGMGGFVFLSMVAFICWEQYLNPETMFQFLIRPPSAAIVFPVEPEEVIVVKNGSSLSLDHMTEATAARIEAKTREQKLGLFKHHCKGVISPTLFGTHCAMGLLGVSFSSTLVLAVEMDMERVSRLDAIAKDEFVPAGEMFGDIPFVRNSLVR